ncbi:MAG TPA: hypothetical protein VEC99_03585 [Clostridia bacterium]|nr:hypothetical protein [Clostridia bacterium]
MKMLGQLGDNPGTLRKKNLHAIALARRGLPESASKGGRERALRLTPQDRRAIATKAAMTRWHGQSTALPEFH